MSIVAGYFDTLGLKTCRNAWIVEAALRPDQLLCLGQRRPRCRDGRISFERLRDERIERGRLEQLPPVEWEIAAADEVLHITAVNRRRST